MQCPLFQLYIFWLRTCLVGSHPYLPLAELTFFVKKAVHFQGSVRKSMLFQDVLLSERLA